MTMNWLFLGVSLFLALLVKAYTQNPNIVGETTPGAPAMNMCEQHFLEASRTLINLALIGHIY